MRSTQIYLLIIGMSLITSCGIYSFTGASISPDIKTVSIQYLANNAPLAKPIISQVFTEGLKDKFNTQTNLINVVKNGDLNFEGEITAYSTMPVALQGNETAAQNRLTISVNIRFINSKNEKQNFETLFTRFADFPSNKNLNEVEETLISEIKDQIIQDIFNKAVINW